MQTDQAKSIAAIATLAGAVAILYFSLRERAWSAVAVFGNAATTTAVYDAVIDIDVIQEPVI